MVTFYLSASRRQLHQQLATTPVRPPPAAHLRSAVLAFPSSTEVAEQERFDLVDALVRAQESAAVQVLLEVCIGDTDEHKNGWELDEIGRIVCAHVHLMFDCCRVSLFSFIYALLCIWAAISTQNDKMRTSRSD